MRLSLLLGNELANEVESEYRLDCPKPLPYLAIQSGSMNSLNHSNNKTLTFIRILSLCQVSLLVSAVGQARLDNSEGC